MHKAGFTQAILAALLAVALPVDPPVHAHGSVTPDEDLCIIRIGFFKAHFKIYLPETHGHRDFCEDLPAIGDAVFVMEYEHDGLAGVPIDFRIIRNITGQGRFTNQDHIEALEELDSVTVFRHPPAIQPDVFMVRHEFPEPGEFVGIVSVERADGGDDYVAVFPFEAGYTGLGYWPWIVAGLIALQLNFLWMSGWLSRKFKRKSADVGKLPGSQNVPL